MAKKIIQTIEGATENTVVYQNDEGVVISVARPKIISVDEILKELGFDVTEKKKKSKKSEVKRAEPSDGITSPENIPNNAPESPSDASEGIGSKRYQAETNGPQKGK